MLQLSPHFSLNELIFTTHDVDNMPNDEQIDSLILLCNNILEPVRAHFKSPVIVTSGFRCPELNKLVGGKFNSQHTLGQAADFNVKNVANDKVWKYIADNLIFDQLIAERLSETDPKAGWLHTSYASHNRHDAISFLGNGKYCPGLKYTD